MTHRRPAHRPSGSAGRIVLLCLSACWAVLSGCSPGTPQPPATAAAPTEPDVVARVGDRTIRIPEFQDWMRRRGVGTNLVQKQALLEEMLDRAAQLRRAEAVGLDRDPEIRRAWENLLVSTLRQRELESRWTNATPTAEQRLAYYTNHLAAFTEPEMRRGALLFAEVSARADDTRRAAARQRLEQARALALQPPAGQPAAGPGFGPLAVDYSDDPLTRYRGGDFGWVAQGKADGRFDPAVLAALFALARTNDVSPVVETRSGFYLVRLLDLRPGAVKPPESVAAVIDHKLVLESRQRMEKEWRESLRAAAKVQVLPGVLESIPPPPGSPAQRPDEPPSPR